MKSYLKLAFAMALAMASMVRAADPIYFVTTDITGAQTQIDTNHMSSWVVNVNSNVDVVGGKFVMKDGSQTVGSLTFSIYAGGLTDAQVNSGSYNPLASITLSNADFDAQVNNGQTFALHTFNFGSVLTLLGGNTYTAALTSAVPDVQAKAYFIKGGTQVMLVDSVTGATNTNALSLTGGTGAINNTDTNPVVSSPAGVPEPSTYALFGLGAVVLVIAARRKRTA